MVLISGYANRVITIKFPELGDDEEIFVVIRNPKTVALSKLEVDQVPFNADGSVDQTAAAEAGYTSLARLVIGGRLYDATVDDIDGVDEDGIPRLVDQPLLTYPLTVESAKKLPVSIINGIFEKINEAQNPR